MDYPKISIVTPSFNQGKYLEATILSVIEQNYPNLEYIIIDGGSTDNSVDIIKKYEKYLTYWVSEKDNGMYHAVQKGFEKSTGEIMAWINSDDLYHKKSLHVVAEIFSNFPDVEWIHGLPTVLDEAGRIVNVVPFRKWSKYNYLLFDYATIQQESCFWKRTLWIKSGSTMNTKLKYAGDFDLWLRFFKDAPLYCLYTVLGCFRARNSNQISLEHSDDYKSEVHSLIESRLKNITDEEKHQLKKLNMYKKFYRIIPFLRILLYSYYVRNLNYPPMIRFERSSQKFVLEEISIYKTVKKTFGFGGLLHGKY